MNGSTCFARHRGCALYQGFAPAESLGGQEAIRMWLPSVVEHPGMISRPMDANRVEWIRAWNNARRAFLADRDVEVVE